MADGAIHKNEKAELGSKLGVGENSYFCLSCLTHLSSERLVSHTWSSRELFTTPGVQRRYLRWRCLFASHRHMNGLDEVTQLEEKKEMVKNRALGSAPFAKGEKEQGRMRKDQPKKKNKQM